MQSLQNQTETDAETDSETDGPGINITENSSSIVSNEPSLPEDNLNISDLAYASDLEAASVQEDHSGKEYASDLKDDLISEYKEDESSILLMASSATAGPVVQSVSLDKKTIAPGETVTITAHITGESDSQYPWVQITSSTGAEHFYEDAWLFKVSEGVYEGTFKAKDNAVSGTYDLSTIYFYDSQGHCTSQDLSGLSFEIAGGVSDNKGPVVESITLNKYEVNYGDTVIFTLVITDESGITMSKYFRPYIYIGRLASGDCFLQHVSGNTYTASYTIRSDDPAIETKRLTVYVRDIYGNETFKDYPVSFTIVNAHAHTVVTQPAVEPTCTSTGLTEGKYCSECGKIITAQKEIPAQGHTIVTDSVVEATCTETGKTEGSHCSVCGEIIAEQETIPALGHTVVIDPAVEATETEEGLTEGSHCSVCGKVLSAQEVVPVKKAEEKDKDQSGNETDNKTDGKSDGKSDGSGTDTDKSGTANEATTNKETTNIPTVNKDTTDNQTANKNTAVNQSSTKQTANKQTAGTVQKKDCNASYTNSSASLNQAVPTSDESNIIFYLILLGLDFMVVLGLLVSYK